jgi:hypothetical protein
VIFEKGDGIRSRIGKKGKDWLFLFAIEVLTCSEKEIYNMLGFATRNVITGKMGW